jgi:hypothetical protein
VVNYLQVVTGTMLLAILLILLPWLSISWWIVLTLYIVGLLPLWVLVIKDSRLNPYSKNPAWVYVLVLLYPLFIIIYWGVQLSFLDLYNRASDVINR